MNEMGPKDGNRILESIFPGLYKPRPDDAGDFGEKYLPPAKFEPWEWHLVAAYPKDPADGDGLDVDVYECRGPARFFKVAAKSTPNSVGEINRGFVLSTGSGDGGLAALLAKEISQGMLVLGKDEAEGG